MGAARPDWSGYAGSSEEVLGWVRRSRTSSPVVFGCTGSAHEWRVVCRVDGLIPSEAAASFADDVGLRHAVGTPARVYRLGSQGLVWSGFEGFNPGLGEARRIASLR